MTANFKILEPKELEQILADPDCVEDLLFPEDVEDPFEGQVELDKEWHNIHYLLTSTLEPDGTALGDAILGGREVGIDLGYGPARLISPNRVKEIAEALLEVDIGQRYQALDRNAEEISELYCGFEFFPEEKNALIEYFQQIDEMYGRAAKQGRAVLAYLA